VRTFRSAKEREAHYRSETIKKVSESATPGAALEFLRETERIWARRVRDMLKLGGLIVSAAGIGVMVFLRALGPSQPIYLVGVIRSASAWLYLPTRNSWHRGTELQSIICELPT
jgi:hypothetical protein